MPAAKPLYRHVRDGMFLAHRHAWMLETPESVLVRHALEEDDPWHEVLLALSILAAEYRGTHSQRERGRIAQDFASLCRGDWYGFDERFAGLWFRWGLTETDFSVEPRPTDSG